MKRLASDVLVFIGGSIGLACIWLLLVAIMS